MADLTPLEQLCYQDKVMLTTTDNPINPFDDWDAWYSEDLRLGHDTCGYIARLFVDYEDMSSIYQAQEYARCVREIFANDNEGLYTLAKRPEHVLSDYSK